mmetsp:Transcript_45843/g.139246  ORF Transcript_45843/g.139246 Transcript_45843/m.139246 type:complete len:809 (-) Transcript_45843:417-2843(-)
MPSVSAHQRLTRVNGVGLWNSWTRNFKTPLLALLDLLDNSVDAAFERPQAEPEGTSPGSLGAGASDSAVPTPDFSGSVSQPLSARKFHGEVHIDADTWNGRTTGLKIINNSSQPVKDLGKIMEVYSSSKGRDEHGADHSQEEDLTFAESIGENGVGLKQGCATLSDLSFVLTRGSDGKMGMAVIAQRLQSAAGVYLPHIYFNSTNLQLLKNEIRQTLASQHYSSVGDCVSVYGDGNFEYGLDRVLRHFAHLTKRGAGEWGEEDNVFCVVLHQPKHGRKTEDVDEVVSQAGLTTTKEQQYQENANFLMQELRDELPRNYIHIDMDIRVGGEKIHFFYWQRRLTELTMFFVNIDETHSYTEADDWQEPEKSYPLRIFCGFDSVRLTGRGGGSCSLNIYSRFSGRLIKHEEDARALLKLPAGGTDYSQGLTIIVDDMLGNLPLNPTKQDVAFGEQAHGDVHKRNIFAWLSGIVRLYYKYHLETNCSGKKGNMTTKVREKGTPVVNLTRLKSLDQSKFTEFRDISWKQVGGTIVPTNRKSMTIELGSDTTRRFRADPSTKPARKPAQKRKRAPTQPTADIDLEDTQPLSSLRKRQRTNVNYNEDDAFEVEVDADVLDDEDGALPVIDVDVPDTAASVAQKVTPTRVSQQNGVKEESTKEQTRELKAHNKALEEEVESLRESSKRHKEKSHERKKIIRQIDGVNRELKQKVATLEAQVSSGSGSSAKKNARELRLEEQVDQLTDALAQQQQQQEESDDAIKALHEQVAALKKENSNLKREKGIRREENECLTVKIEEVTRQLENRPDGGIVLG